MYFTSYAQNYEDVLLWRALKHVEQGFYIDVGAADPTTDSVTRAFYERGWRGINLEPARDFFSKLRAVRPEDTNLEIAVGEKPGEAIFFADLEGGLSTLVPQVAASARTQGYRIEETRVSVRTLAEICAAHARTPIHFLKIDVEGAEWGVLAGADFTTYRPWIVIVEATYPLTQIDTYGEWEPLLLSAGYRFVWFDGLNRFYIAEEKFAELGPKFSVPVNVFDDFVRFDPIAADKIISLSRESHEYAVKWADADRKAVAQEEEFTQKINDKDSALRNTGDQLRLCEDQLRQNEAALTQTKVRLDAMLKSRSWRMTAPLRRLSGFLQSRFGR